jgi:hypothetical protein
VSLHSLRGGVGLSFRARPLHKSSAMSRYWQTPPSGPRRYRAGRGGEDRRHGSADPARLGHPVQRSGAGRPPGAPGKLSKEHKAFLARLVEEGPTPPIHGVVRWRACDLIMRLHEEFGISVSDDMVYRVEGAGFLACECPTQGLQAGLRSRGSVQKNFPTRVAEVRAKIMSIARRDWATMGHSM